MDRWAMKGVIKVINDTALNLNSYSGQHRPLKKFLLRWWIIPWAMLCRLFFFFAHYITMPHYTIDLYGLCVIYSYLLFVIIFVWHTTKTWQQEPKIFWRAFPILFLSFFITIPVIFAIT